MSFERPIPRALDLAIRATVSQACPPGILDLTYSLTSSGIWVARASYIDDSFCLVEGQSGRTPPYEQKIINTQGPLRTSKAIPVGQFSQEKAREAVKQYREAVASSELLDTLNPEPLR